MAEKRKISRREFTCGAAMAAAAVVLPLDLAAQSDKAATPVKPPEQPQVAAGEELSATAKAEAQQSYRAVMEKYGDRFSDEQKKDIARLLEQQQKSIETVRKFTLENGDAPATVLRLIGEEDTHAAR